MQKIEFECGDILTMKKKHPCSSDQFKVVRTGSDVRMICCGCGRDLTFKREAVEKMIKKVTGK